MGAPMSRVEPPDAQNHPASDTTDAGSASDSRPPEIVSADVAESGDASPSLINVNTAGEAELTALRGIGTKTAAAIVAYRAANGPFGTVDELVNVKGVSSGLVERLRPFVSVGRGGSGGGGDAGGGGPLPAIAPDRACYPTCPCLGPEFPAPIPRPGVKLFSGLVRGRPAVRIASWNLQCCSADKMDNNGVLEVVCLTLLEQGIKLLAVQELADKDALQKLCTELNAPSLRSVREWPRPRGQWRCVVSENPTGPMYQSMEYAGFAWDASSGLELLSEGLVGKKKKGSKHFARYPYLGYFKAGRFDFTLVNVHLKATGLGNAELEKLQLEIMKLPQLLELLEEHLSGEKDTLLLGDFNLTPDASDFDALRSKGFSSCVPANVFTNISLKNPDGSKSFDNMWISPAAKQLYTGGWSVVRQGLSHRLIPDGWSWGGVASDHCPIWAEFHSDRDNDSRPENADVRGITMLGREP